MKVTYSPLWINLLRWEVKIFGEEKTTLAFLTRKKKTLQNAICEQDRRAKQDRPNSGPIENILILYTIHIN